MCVRLCYVYLLRIMLVFFGYLLSLLLLLASASCCSLTLVCVASVAFFCVFLVCFTYVCCMCVLQVCDRCAWRVCRRQGRGCLTGVCCAQGGPSGCGAGCLDGVWACRSRWSERDCCGRCCPPHLSWGSLRHSRPFVLAPV